MKSILSIAAAAFFVLTIFDSTAQTVAPYEEVPADGAITTDDYVHLEPVYPSLPYSVTSANSPAPSVSFQGLDDNQTSIPPDTHGAVGPSHVLTMLNTQVRIQNRTGTTNISTVTLSNWWSGAGSFQSVFDPKVLYDPYSSRWIATACTDAQSSNSAVMLAVSQTADPTGAWHFQKIDADASNVVWADYPSLGFNKDWIVVSFNMFTNVGNGFRNCRLYVFNKTNAYAGGTTRTIINNANNAGSTVVPAITYSATEATLYCLQTWNSRSTNAEGVVNGFLRLYTITGTPSSPTLTATTNFPATDPWAPSPPTANFAPQTNTTVKIRNNDSRIQNVVFRNGSLWAAHTVYYPYTAATRSSVQWWQLATNGAIQQVGRVDDQAGINFYAFPSIAVNKFDDALIGYSSFSTNQFASANYSFRVSSDIQNRFRLPATLKAGEGIYYKTFGTGVNRWGDYSATMVDPTNDADFWTIQEYAATPVNPATTDDNGRFGVWWGSIVVPTPTNDNFANAIQLTGIKGTNDATLFRATKETGEPNHAGATGGRSIWYSWTPATNGWVSFDTLRSLYSADTVIAVYTGTAVNSLTLVASNDDRDGTKSYVYFNATANTTYRIAIDAKTTPSEIADAIVLYWEQSIAPTFALEPSDDHILAGDQLVLLSLAIGNPTPTYQWRLNGANITGATYANYTNSSIATNQGGAYTVVASNSAGSITSRVANVYVYPSATAIHDGFEYLGSDKFKFVVTGIPGYNYVVEATTDFTNWVTVHTNTSSFSYTNLITTNYPYRFFRSKY